MGREYFLCHKKIFSQLELSLINDLLCCALGAKCPEDMSHIPSVMFLMPFLFAVLIIILNLDRTTFLL